MKYKQQKIARETW